MTKKQKNLLRALIVDDEPPAQRRLMRLLLATGRVEVAFMAQSVEEALNNVREGDIDVAFLDIQMPREDGFAYVEKVPFDVAIVFVTAFSSYAVRAFEVAALDYLLKPVEQKRLDAMLNRVEEKMRTGIQPETETGGCCVKTAPSGDRLADRKARLICLQLTGGARFVAEKDIVCVLAQDDYTQVMLNDGSAELVSVSMQKWEETLPAPMFERVHRSAIASVYLIKKIYRQGGRWLAQMHGLTKPVPINRAAARRLRNCFSR
ncbi:MAG: response regulator transcription factor [Deltaproteobacteria bacterium]|nr:response regulator transcription factor [Deltaproteobacteria bacterium]